MSDPGINPLIIAEAANPEWTSVPLVGWAHARAIQDHIGGHLVTQIRNEPAIQSTGLSEDLYTTIDSELVARVMWKIGSVLSGGSNKGWTTKMAAAIPSYLYFEHLVWKKFKDRLRSGEFSLVHRVTPLSPTVPSLLASKCAKIGVPFVIGPLNGGVPWPRAFDSARRKEKEWLSYVRGAYRFLPYYHSTRKHASAIICGSRDTEKQMPRWAREKMVYVPENAVDPIRFTEQRAHCATKPLKCIFLGRLVPYKGCDMLIEAAAELCRAGDVRLEIVGDGPERSRLEAMVEELGIQDSVTFAGNVPHTDVQKYLAGSDLLTFPTIREFGGAVLLEAMAVGTPPMAVAYGGPAEIMSESTSFPIELGTRAQIVERVRDRLTRIANDPSIIDEKSICCRDRVDRLFTWDKKAMQVREVYEWALGRADSKPGIDFSDDASGILSVTTAD